MSCGACAAYPSRGVISLTYPSGVRIAAPLYCSADEVREGRDLALLEIPSAVFITFLPVVCALGIERKSGHPKKERAELIIFIV